MKYLLGFLFSCCVLTVSAQTISLRMNQFDPDRFNRSVMEQGYEMNGKGEVQSIQFQNSVWSVNPSFEVQKDGVVDVKVTLQLVEGQLDHAAPSIDLTFDNWSVQNYVLLPGAAYNGNRFESRRIRYSPKLMDPRDYGPDQETIVSDVPRLNINEGPSKIQERSGSMTIPAAGFFSPSQQQGFWMLFPQANQWGDFGLSLEENKDRSKMTMSLTAPVVRETYKYRIADNRYPSDDVPPSFKPGDQVTFQFQLHTFPAENIQAIYDKLFHLRKSWIPEGSPDYAIPMSACFEVQEQKFNEQNFVPEHGYYAVGMRNGKYRFLQDWQIGWTGGMITTYPLLFAGQSTTVDKVIQNFDWLFDGGIAPSGFFWDAGESDGDQFTWYGGDIRKLNTKDWHLIRKSGDAIYYIIKQLMLMEQKNIPVKAAWRAGTKTVCDALANLWEQNGQFGQFVDSQTGEIQSGGTTSGAIIPAGLSLAADYFKEPKYQVAAEASAEYFYQNYIAKGITNGGPGDAMQNPDSESSYAMLESFILLYEHTGEQKWLDYAEDMAKQFASWVMSYNYEFPANTTLGKMGIKTVGSVFANTQNKHGAPGICTHSGVALLRLYRATGNAQYLELLQDITRHIPQNLSHPLRPIEGMKMGWMSERVSTTDWYEGIGELMYGSTWAETALMLTFIEIPGLYVQPDRGFFYAFDQIKVTKEAEDEETLTLNISNPTEVPAEIKVLVENSSAYQQALGENHLLDTPTVQLAPGASIIKTFKK